MSISSGIKDIKSLKNVGDVKVCKDGKYVRDSKDGNGWHDSKDVKNERDGKAVKVVVKDGKLPGTAGIARISKIKCRGCQ